ncbi:hypothetical protein GCM10027429_35100 [Marivirga atlantica]|jgi:hypothetical protein
MFGITELLEFFKIHMNPGGEGFGADTVHLGQLIFIVGFDFGSHFILELYGHHPGRGMLRGGMG